MKTPIQQLIEKWEQKKDSHISNSPTFQEFINDAKAMLEAEKEFIREIYWEGGQDVPCHSSMVDMWFDGVFEYND